MSEGREAGIKLFGHTIQFQEIELPSSPNTSRTELGSVCEEHELDKDSVVELNDERRSVQSEEVSDSKTSALINENPKNPSSIDNEVKMEEEHSETSNADDKTLKKPDKLIPCPRCNSMDTKFCYYNNYNVNQPRHFCKKCQRYWTAGGTMRNVPVGAGRRKNKNLPTQFNHHITVSEALQSTTACDGTVLAFGEPMSTVTTARAHLKSHVDNSDDRSSGSSTNDDASRIGVHCLPGAPFPYPWNPAQWNSAPMPFYPVLPYWGCAVPPPGSWNLQWVPQPAVSSTLGKHSREEPEHEAEKENNPEKSLWFPKTMRVNESSESASSKTSLWAALGFQNDKTDCVRGGSLFKAFKSKGDEKTPHLSESNMALKANPAAFSRSLSFNESS